jgi:2-polyprenyl-6-methoxyphenol hydroxylase-like FAD-dependent oxidoreductase
MPQKVVVVGAGPVGALAALYAAVRGHNVEIYELRPGTFPKSRERDICVVPAHVVQIYEIQNTHQTRRSRST